MTSQETNVITTTSTIGIVGEETSKQETIKIIRDINTTLVQDEKPLKKKKTPKKKSTTHPKKPETTKIVANFITQPPTGAIAATPAHPAKGRKERGPSKGAAQGRRQGQQQHSGALPFCPHFYSCNESTDPRHTKAYRHICSLGQSCTQKEDPKHARMYYHFSLPACPKGKDCEQLTDPAHRAAFHHSGFTDAMQPCRFHKDCKKTEDRNHLLRYQHSDPFYFPQDGVAPAPEFAAIASKTPITPTNNANTNINTNTQQGMFPPLSSEEKSTTEEEVKEAKKKEEEPKKIEEEEESKKIEEKEKKSTPVAVPAEIVDAAYAEMAAAAKREHSANAAERKEKKSVAAGNNNNNNNNNNNGNNGGDEKVLTPCSHPFECRVKVDESHMYYHACSSSKSECHHLRKGKGISALHSRQCVHYANERCKQGKACPFIYDPQHRAYFAHQGEPDFLIPCKFATKCKLLDDPQHRLRFQHFETHYFPPFPQTFTPEAKAPVSENGGIPLCNAFFACPLLGDAAHVAQAMHACPWGQDCDKLGDEFHAAHYYHYDHPLCQGGKDCLMLNDPLHRAQFHHKGLPDYINPCGFGRACLHISNPEHCAMYQHGVIPIMPCVPPVAVAQLVDAGKKGAQGHYRMNGRSQGFQLNIFTPMMFNQGMKGGKKMQGENGAAANTTAATQQNGEGKQQGAELSK